MYQVVRYRRAWSKRREDGRRAWGLRAWVWALGVARVAEARLSLLKTAATLTSLIAFICLLPLLLMMFVWIKLWRVCVGVWVVRAVEGVEGLVLGGHHTPTHAHTLLLCLSGNPSLDHIRQNIKEKIVDRLDDEGRLLYPNLRRCMVQMGGYQVWRRHPAFNVTHHVYQSPLHHSGRLVTHRNIQECVSEVVSQPLPRDLPPWQVILISGHEGGGSGGREGGGATWVVARAHPTLVAELSLPDLLATAHPDPWRYPATRGLTLLDAPAATRRLVEALVERLRQTVVWGTEVVSTYWQQTCEQFLAPIRFQMEEMLQAARKATPEDLPLPAATAAGAVLTLMQVWRRLQATLTSLWYSLRSQLYVSSLWRWWMWCVVTGVKQWWRCVVWGVVAPWWVWRWVSLVARSPEMTLVVEAGVEVYWLVRALVSLPRLVLAEVVNTWGSAPLTSWVGRRGSMHRQKGVAVAWSDPVPLSTARGVRGATGATLSEVLLTASTGAIRDYLRVTGLTVPDQVRCSLSVYSPRHAHSTSHAHACTSSTIYTHNSHAHTTSHVHTASHTHATPGFVTLPLPTGESDATSALKQLRSAMESIRSYPERYLASMWLLRHVAYILPRPMLGPACRALAATCPVLLSNLAGPHQPEVLWGHEILDVLYWRPPHDGAVLSVCVTSYRGRAVLGVAGDARVVPGAATLPQAFVTHLNELAVETGVRLERPSPRSCWFRNSSPTCSPSPTPPPTPTPTPTQTFFSSPSTPNFFSPPPTPTLFFPSTPNFFSPPPSTTLFSPKFTPSFFSPPPTATFFSPSTLTSFSPSVKSSTTTFYPSSPTTPPTSYAHKPARSTSQCRRVGVTATSRPQRRKSAFL